MTMNIGDDGSPKRKGASIGVAPTSYLLPNDVSLHLSSAINILDLHHQYPQRLPPCFLLHGINESESTPEAQFGPAMLFELWRDRIRWPGEQRHLRTMKIPCAHVLALQDSNRLINNPELRIKMKTLTIHKLRTLLHPQKLIQVFKDLAPFMWQILHTFCASPNNHRRRQAAEIAVLIPKTRKDWADDPNLESGEVDPDSVPSHWSREYAGFARNPVFAILVCLSMLVFVRNRATNVLPLILGLFFKISGTSTRVIQMLSNAGVCVSGDTIERLKERSQQRLSNTNDMINATNCAIIGINGVESFTPADLTEKLALRGNRAQAKPADILPTPEDNEIKMIVAYCPGNGLWHERKEIAAGVAKMMPLDRPLPPEKTDGQGSKKGVVKVLQSVQEHSTLSQKIWSSISRIFVGDWLTSNNLRAARRDRTDDINTMERLRTECTMALALQATHMIMRTHYGQAVEDPASLAAHKGLLNRKWDVNKPNYAAKSQVAANIS
ncbi:hypothetical protein B0H14DRAFT_2597693 [Mycena olivaceomarginata]|nr:hypothetical protein B0H14DRAFT_2597693 [Mycena olivaceomarginata]